MAPTLYVAAPSPPSRAVLMTAKSIGLSLDVQEIDPIKGEHMMPEFLKLNPQHTVPVLVDEDGFVVWDSHAIMPYLLSKYAKDDSLYPEDPKKRALIDQRLHFDSGVSWACVLRVMKPILYRGVKVVPDEEVEAANDIYSFVETFLDGRKWIAGDSVTIADFSYVTTFKTLDVIAKIDGEKFPKLVAYLTRGTALPAYSPAKNGHQIYVALMKAALG